MPTLCRGRCLISDLVNSKRRGTDAIRADALLIDFSERAFISLRKSTLALFKFSLILLQSAIPRTLAKNANRTSSLFATGGMVANESMRFPCIIS